MTYEELTKSLEILGLPERVTLGEIKHRFRLLVKEAHPESFQTIHTAYRTLMEYAEAYKTSFSEDEFYVQNPEERLRKTFQDDPVWGGK